MLALCCLLWVQVLFPSQSFTAQTHQGMSRSKKKPVSGHRLPPLVMDFHTFFGLWFSSSRLRGVMSLCCSVARQNWLVLASLSHLVLDIRIPPLLCISSFYLPPQLVMLHLPDVVIGPGKGRWIKCGSLVSAGHSNLGETEMWAACGEWLLPYLLSGPQGALLPFSQGDCISFLA